MKLRQLLGTGEAKIKKRIAEKAKKTKRRIKHRARTMMIQRTRAVPHKEEFNKKVRLLSRRGAQKEMD